MIEGFESTGREKPVPGKDERGEREEGIAFLIPEKLIEGLRAIPRDQIVRLLRGAERVVDFVLHHDDTERFPLPMPPVVDRFKRNDHAGPTPIPEEGGRAVPLRAVERTFTLRGEENISPGAEALLAAFLKQVGGEAEIISIVGNLVISWKNEGSLEPLIITFAENAATISGPSTEIPDRTSLELAAKKAYETNGLNFRNEWGFSKAA